MERSGAFMARWQKGDKGMPGIRNFLTVILVGAWGEIVFHQLIFNQCVKPSYRDFQAWRAKRKIIKEGEAILKEFFSYAVEGTAPDEDIFYPDDLHEVK